MKRLILLTLCLMLFGATVTLAGAETLPIATDGSGNPPGRSAIRVVEKQLVTYPYSAPRKVVDFGRFYPYHRFDGFTAEGRPETWRMVEMENDYVKLWVMPAVGGKVWGAVDKTTGREFIYFNHVVKFRDVAMRGPWTSGGIEMNFGVVGHSPWCSDAVDFKLTEYPDGSVGCTVGSHDLALETDWRVEVLLPPDKACFETRVLWFNGSGWDRPAYQWMNAGIKTAGDLEYFFPGDRYLEHDGSVRPWPADSLGHRLNRYEENDHGHYKSYHVAGRYTDFWGAYWLRDGFGMGHTADYADKPGKKVWIWGLSDYGMLWEDLLTDSDGQYTEVQAGRLLNQSNAASFRTPFKHAKLAPYTTQTWTEYWYPVRGTEGMLYGSPELVFNIVERDGARWLKLYAVSPLRDTLRLESGGRTILSRGLNMQPAQLDSLRLPAYDPQDFSVSLDGRTLYAATAKPLDRPSALPDGFDQQSVYGLYLQGREFERQFLLDMAEEKYRRALEKDPYYQPALVALAGIAYERHDLERADSLLRTALAIDTYDGGANYLRGLVQARFGERDNALDALSLASQSAEYGPAACTELGRLAAREGDYARAQHWLVRALECNPRNLTALQLQAVVAHLTDDDAGAEAALLNLLTIDPLNPVAAAERWLRSGDEADRRAFVAGIRGAYGFESYLNVADFYTALGRYAEALRILDTAPAHTKITYWQAWLHHLSGQPEQARAKAAEAYGMNQSLVFAWRKSERELFDWLWEAAPGWQAAYQLALLEGRAGRTSGALQWLNRRGDEADFFPYYALRAAWDADPSRQETDLLHARELAPEHPYTALLLARHYQGRQLWSRAVAVLRGQYALNRTDYSVGMELAKTLSLSGDYRAAVELMKDIEVLPYEGAQEGRNLWRESHLRLAARLIAAGESKQAGRAVAQARTWPRHLGVGKPYDDLVDERVENFLDLCILRRTQAPRTRPSVSQPETALASYAARTSRGPFRSADLLTALVLREGGDRTWGEERLAGWLAAEPASQAARWCWAVWRGDWDQAARIAAEAPQVIERLPYVSYFEDRDFSLLKDNADLLKACFYRSNR